MSKPWDHAPVELTDDEYRAIEDSDACRGPKGWWFCCDWDFMLINRDWPESEYCSCCDNRG